MQTISRRLARYLVCQGLLTQDAENSYLALEPDVEESPLPHLQQHSITYRIAVGPQQGRKVFSLQTIPPKQSGHQPISPVGKKAGFSLHARISGKKKPSTRKSVRQHLKQRGDFREGSS